MNPLQQYREATELLNVDKWARRSGCTQPPGKPCECDRVPLFPSGFCREEVDLETVHIRIEIVKGLLAFAAILAIGVFLIVL